MSLEQMCPLGSQGFKGFSALYGSLQCSLYWAGFPALASGAWASLLSMDHLCKRRSASTSSNMPSRMVSPSLTPLTSTALFTNELLVGKAMKHFPREHIQLATKFGSVIENGVFSVKGSADYVRQACEASLKRLDVDYIDLYYQHRVDQSVPIEETVGELKKLVQEGKVKYIGLSEASASTIRRAHAVHPVTAVQLEWSLWSRDAEEDVIPTCRELGIGIVAYSPLGHGFFSGKAIFESLDATDTRTVCIPRFEGENLEKNKVFYERIANLAKKHVCTPGQLALAWVLRQGDDVVPIPGTTKAKNFDENVGALKVKLSVEDLEEISSAVPASEVSGERHNEEIDRLSYKYADTPPLKL
ncbi:hypothetical protein GOP47_0020787 [Adiantum capillus-veneris]|uniref:NADP-dependent oxidoreductase domain-containing protein n=1 Tax=Adiantum capillus-veneris TaxID=13818 RepID=A0A9D4Z827_ADICA|nr:hypothetical protein GOP47_0020787 [Adiantum capillus-veneris]